MNGIDKIAARIQADAQAESDALNAETDAACAQLTAEYEAKARAVYDERMKKGSAECETRAQRLGAAADMEARKAILAFKQEMVSEAFEKAVQSIIGLPADKYIEFLASTAAAASDNGTEELVFNAADRKAHGEAVAKRANAILREKGAQAHLSVSADTADIPGGLLVRHGDIEVNCAADIMVRQYRDRLASQVAKMLFA